MDKKLSKNIARVVILLVIGAMLAAALVPAITGLLIL